MSEIGINTKEFPCPCCGSDEKFKEGDFAVCGRCGWENDKVQNADPTYAGGANKMNLNDARKKYRLISGQDIN